MELEGKKSKVALCPHCGAYVLACHVDYLRKETEKEFTKFTNEGFIVQIETIPETQAREFSFYEDCIKNCFKPF